MIELQMSETVIRETVILSGEDASRSEASS
jgi:hypothetical protein